MMAGGRHGSWATAAAPSILGILLGAAMVAGSVPAAEQGATAASPRRDAPVMEGGASAAGPTPYAAILAREAASRGLPPALADAVAYVESGYDAGAVGSVGELGLMQVRPATAAMLGHRGPAAELLDPATNARFGVAYLAGAWRLTGGDLCLALAKYRAGHGQDRLTPRSVDYCRRARDRLAAMGSPLAAAPEPRAVTPASVASRVPAPAVRSMRPALAGLVNRFWAEHVARVRAAEARSDRIMRGG